jgi:hypothetical protein
VSLFSLDAQVLGIEHHISVEDTAAGLIVSTSNGRTRARSFSEAARIAARELGSFLERAQRQDLPWGLKVAVGPVAAVYGSWPLLPGPAEPRPRPSLIARIRQLWRDTDGPLGALDNAIKIVEAYRGRARAA